MCLQVPRNTGRKDACCPKSVQCVDNDFGQQRKKVVIKWSSSGILHHPNPKDQMGGYHLARIDDMPEMCVTSKCALKVHTLKKKNSLNFFFKRKGTVLQGGKAWLKVWLDVQVS